MICLGGKLEMRLVVKRLQGKDTLQEQWWMKSRYSKAVQDMFNKHITSFIYRNYPKCLLSKKISNKYNAKILTQ